MTAWLAPALAYLPQWLDYRVAQDGLPGASLAVAHEGRLVLAHAVGVADLATNEALTPAHRFRVASHSKTFTATGVMKLVEAGRLRLDDRVGTHVAGLHPEVARATVAQLLSHTAGIIRDGEDAGQWVDRRPFLAEAELRAALAEAPVLPANTRFKYSNHAFGLAGLVIEAVTGERYGDWIAREIVAPAGLAHTVPDGPLPVGSPFARGHAAPMLLGRRFTVPADNPTNALAAATGFISTPSDLVTFYSQLDPASPSALLGVGSRREMTRSHWRIPELGGERSYGLGTASGHAGGWSYFGHGGGFQGVRSATVMVPDIGVAVSLCIHAADGDPHPKVETALGILQRFAAGGAPSPATADWSGRFWNLWGAADLIPLADKVLVAYPGQGDPFGEAVELTIEGPDAARITRASGYGSFGQTARLQRDGAGQVEAVLFGGSLLKRHEAAAREAEALYGV